ncbi:uncharacterized protein SPPG_05683 [Spizellomyces punctatus DAOM BR117]|uniref:Helicase ATP-binding domain-containing protein n=1 Tax=Spizellomyces punctatus (strain DAOM BR117) TaxID=645134 RepID=A0A0L0HF75_SPIPD|nr:uncharacterized protein SPPG_05683 [Spizellomyces punctatus DAOM BR117]KNC99443.1 hypothetical protein SPPG_05683 [Spizellomyces punctatus DAOM BR117]|eukprot:XP_016607483.1 hypothetical protein SPPG_05683 [Spizellomyces punctatus DAOM BR117]
MRHLKLQVPVHSRIESDADEVALSYHGDGIQERAIQGLEELIAAPPEPVLNRVLYYLDTFNRDVALNDIARDGAGMEYQVNLWDAFTYRWLLRFSTLFPGALRPIPHRLNCFIVPNGPLLWFLFGRIQTLVKNRRNEQRTNAAFGHAAAAANGDGGQWNYTAWRSPFAPWLHQQEAVRDMEVRREKGRRNHYLHAPMGAGKTLIVSLYILHLAQRGLLPRHIVWTLPGEAIESVSGELNAFGFQVDWMLPQKDSSKKVIPEGVTKQANVQGLRPHVITLIEHDDLRKLPDLLRSLADELFIVVDEVHKTLAATQRTTITLEIARLARGGCVAMTGTPTVDNKIYKLVPWLSLMVRFPVNLRNFWAACNSMVSQQVDTGIRVHMQEVEAQWTSREEEQRYRSLVPDKLGGTNSHASQKDIDQAKKLCYNACTQHMVQLTLDLLHDKLHYGKVEQWKGGVFLEAKDEQHQNELIAALVRESRKRDDVRVLTEGDIFKITGGASLHLTDKTVALGEVKDYPIVITTTRKSAGYTLSRLKAFVSLVYPSNLATRLQLAGRLNRLSQAAKELDYYKVHIGLLTSILHYHDQAASIDKALKDMGVRIPT